MTTFITVHGVGSGGTFRVAVDKITHMRNTPGSTTEIHIGGEMITVTETLYDIEELLSTPDGQAETRGGGVTHIDGGSSASK